MITILKHLLLSAYAKAVIAAALAAASLGCEAGHNPFIPVSHSTVSVSELPDVCLPTVKTPAKKPCGCLPGEECQCGPGCDCHPVVAPVKDVPPPAAVELPAVGSTAHESPAPNLIADEVAHAVVDGLSPTLGQLNDSIAALNTSVEAQTKALGLMEERSKGFARKIEERMGQVQEPTPPASPTKRIVDVYSPAGCPLGDRVFREVVACQTVDFHFHRDENLFPWWVIQKRIPGTMCYVVLHWKATDTAWKAMSRWPGLKGFLDVLDGKVRVSEAPLSAPVRQSHSGYPVRGDWWTGCGSWRHLTQGEHAGKFNQQWLQSLSAAEIQSLHSDDHEGHLKWQYVVRP